MSLTRECIRRPVAVAMFYLAVAVVGVISFARLPIELLPDIAYPALVIYTGYPGVGPAEVERYVTAPVEEQVARVPGAHEVTSVSREGASMVTVRFIWGTDMEFAVLNVRERLQTLAPVLPERADRPIVLRLDPRSEPLMAVAVAGGSDLRALRELAGTVFRRRLEQIDGVAQVVVTGGLEREIQVEVDVDRMAAHGVAIGDVAAALEAANYSFPGGAVRRGGFSYPLRTVGHLASVSALENVVVARRDRAGRYGPALIMLRDIATVRDGFEDPRSITRFNGEESVGLLLFRESDANAVQVAREVGGVLAQLGAEHDGIRLRIATSQSDFIEDAISNVVWALLIGAVLAFLVLFLFLRDPRYPIAVALAIPVSAIGAFLLLDLAGVSLNIMSLGGLALGVGMLVDNSVVVLENISRQRELQRRSAVGPAGPVGRAGPGGLAAVAAALGAEEVKGAITASTLTTITVFGPILYVEGVAGSLFGALSLSVASSLLVSLLVALTLLPAIAARWEEPGRVLPPRAFDRAFGSLAEWHQRVLAAALRNRRRVALAALLLMVVSFGFGRTLERAMLPPVDHGAFTVRLELPVGAALEETADVVAQLERVLVAEPGVAAVVARVGEQGGAARPGIDRIGPHTAAIDVLLDDGYATGDVVAAARPRLHAVHPGGVAISTSRSSALGRMLDSHGADIAVRVRGEDASMTLAYAQTVERALRHLPALTDVRVDAEPGQPEVQIVIDGEQAAAFGLDPRRIAETVEHSVLGARATQLVEFDRRTPVVVRLPERDRWSPGMLDALQVDGIPLRALADTREARGPSEIQRRDRARVVPVLADVAHPDLAGAIVEVRRTVAEHPAPPGVRAEIGGANDEMRRSFRDLRFAFALALVLVYMILAAQLESFVHPLTILLAVPLALAGAVAALRIAGGGLNTMSLIGAVILAGVVVNDAILKVDFIQKARAGGAALDDAILEAGAARLRPIVMTTATTVLGLAPMAFAVGRGADLRAPLAIVVIGGLLTASILTLIVVPVAYHVLESGRARMGRWVGRT